MLKPVQTITINLRTTKSGASRMGASRMTVTHHNSNGKNINHRPRDYGMDPTAQADDIATEMATLMCVTILGVLQPPRASFPRTYAMTEHRSSR